MQHGKVLISELNIVDTDSVLVGFDTRKCLEVTVIALDAVLIFQ